MSSSELLDAFDDDGNPLGPLPRSEVHARGLWHHVFHCLVIATRAGIPTAVLQRRSASKAAFPNLLDVSAGGHLLSGESLADGVRELHEEMGIEPTFDELVELGEFRLTDSDPGSEGDNREIIHAYLYFDDRPMSAYNPDPVELSGIAEVALADLTSLYTDSNAEVLVLERSLDGTETPSTVGSAGVVPDANNYMVEMLAAAALAVSEQR